MLLRGRVLEKEMKADPRNHTKEDEQELHNYKWEIWEMTNGKWKLKTTIAGRHSQAPGYRLQPIAF